MPPSPRKWYGSTFTAFGPVCNFMQFFRYLYLFTILQLSRPNPDARFCEKSEQDKPADGIAAAVVVFKFCSIWRRNPIGYHQHHQKTASSSVSASAFIKCLMHCARTITWLSKKFSIFPEARRHRSISLQQHSYAMAGIQSHRAYIRICWTKMQNSSPFHVTIFPFSTECCAIAPCAFATTMPNAFCVKLPKVLPMHAILISSGKSLRLTWSVQNCTINTICTNA